MSIISTIRAGAGMYATQRGTNDDGVYKGMESPHKVAQKMKEDIQAQRESIASDPNKSVAEKRTELCKLDNAEKLVDRALNNTTNDSVATHGKYIGSLVSSTEDLFNRTEGNVNDSWNSLGQAESILQDLNKTPNASEMRCFTLVDSPPILICNGPVIREMDSSRIDLIQNNAVKATDRSEKATGSSATNSNKETTSSQKSKETKESASNKETDRSDDAKLDAQQQAYKANFAGKEPTELANWASADPKGFYENLKDLSPEDRQSTMMMMNQHLQDMNQMFSMMSNLAKAQHDTAKALIGNMRV